MNRLKDSKSKQLIDKLSLKYKLDRRIVKEITDAPFKFMRMVAADVNDIRPIRFKYFGVFVQRPTRNKRYVMVGKYKQLMDNIGEVYLVMKSILHFPVKDVSSAKKVIDDALNLNDIWKIHDIYKAWNEYKGVKKAEIKRKRKK